MPAGIDASTLVLEREEEVGPAVKGAWLSTHLLLPVKKKRPEGGVGGDRLDDLLVAAGEEVGRRSPDQAAPKAPSDVLNLVPAEHPAWVGGGVVAVVAR